MGGNSADPSTPRQPKYVNRKGKAWGVGGRCDTKENLLKLINIVTEKFQSDTTKFGLR